MNIWADESRERWRNNPDLKKIMAQARTDSQTGERLWVIHDPTSIRIRQRLDTFATVLTV